jgi:hypothetical protein
VGGAGTGAGVLDGVGAGAAAPVLSTVKRAEVRPCSPDSSYRRTSSSCAPAVAVTGQLNGSVVSVPRYLPSIRNFALTVRPASAADTVNADAVTAPSSGRPSTVSPGAAAPALGAAARRRGSAVTAASQEWVREEVMPARSVSMRRA